MTDTDAHDTLVIDEPDPLKRGKLLFEMMHPEKNSFPIVSLSANDNTHTYNKFLHHIFEFGQELWDVSVPKLGWKPFRVDEPQDMKISQLCMNQVSASKHIPHFYHLCQKHSDDIAHPNQMPCGTYSTVCDKVCHHYTMMDNDVIVKLWMKK
jgi:hypothetical protein